jgi:site-specific recombinase XerD
MILDLQAYRRYMKRRGYAKETRWARHANAVRWVRWVPDWRHATFRDVERWIDQRDVSPASERNLIGYLRAFYRWAIREGLCEIDPTVLVEWPRMPRRLPRPAPEQAIADVLEQADSLTAAMVALEAGGGLRCCEVSRLDWADVDLVEGRIRVTGKGRERIVHLPGWARDRLAALPREDWAVFRGPYGRRLSPARVSQIVCRAFHGAGYSVVAHQLRHRAATIAYAQPGADPFTVRDFLGHASVATTLIYTKVAPSRVVAMSRSIPPPVTR